MSAETPSAGEVLRRHQQVTDADVVALCSCGTAGIVSALNQVGLWHAQHQADMLAAAGLLATAEHVPTPGVLRLDHLLAVFRVGSGDWSWQEEHDLLYARPWQVTLTQQIAAEGIREPVLLGSDGRIWDGHHRICAAMHLGLDTVPVEWSSDAGLAEHDAQVAARAWDEGYDHGRYFPRRNPYRAARIAAGEEPA